MKRIQLPFRSTWSPEFQQQLNDALEQQFAKLNEFALVPYGGLEGQVLKKTSDRPYVMEWGEGGGGGAITWATCAEADAGVVTDKAINPEVGACSYDRKRVWGQHEAGKGTEMVTLAIVADTVTIDCHASNVFEVELTGNITMAAPTNPVDGQVINVIIRQDVTGGRTITWNAVWAFFGGVPAMTTTAGATDLISCQYDSTLGLWLCSFLAGATGGAGGGGTPYALASIGAGAAVYKETVDVLGTDTARIRSITGSNGITVTQNADEIDVKMTRTIFVQSAEPTANAVNDLWFW
jgi:hypothetical protein